MRAMVKGFITQWRTNGDALFLRPMAEVTLRSYATATNNPVVEEMVLRLPMANNGWLREIDKAMRSRKIVKITLEVTDEEV